MLVFLKNTSHVNKKCKMKLTKNYRNLLGISCNNHFLLTISYISNFKNPTISKRELNESIPLLTK